MRTQRISILSTLALIAFLFFPSAVTLLGDGGQEKRDRRIIPLPVFFITPETGFGLGASALYYVSPYTDAVIQKPDVASVVAFYTQKNQLLVAAGSEIYLRRSGDRLNVEGIVERFPDKFWGIGPDTPDQNEEAYTPFEVGFGIGYQWNLSRGFFLGPLYVFSLIDTKEVEEGGLLDEGLVSGSDGTRASGVGVRFTADRRDSTFYPRRGYLIDTTVVLYCRVLGSTSDFSQLLFDYRQFFPLFERHVFGLQYILDLSTGDVPFQYQPKLGGRIMMRGYYEGRYRDMNYTALQGEYRLPLFWRFGMVVFGSLGKVAPDMSRLLSAEYLRAAGGVGLRLMVEEERHINFRADVAFTGRDTAVYFSILEAF
jgi:hypothetical protein